MRGGCARRSNDLNCSCPRPVLGEIAYNAFSMGSPALSGAPGCGGLCAGRSQVAVALSAVASCDRLTVPVLGASRRGRWADGLEAAPRDLGQSWRSGDRSPHKR